MQRVRAGDREAFEEVYRRHAERVFAYLWRLLGDAASAADLRQDAFLRLWQGRTAWREGGSVAGYLIRTAHNLALNEARSRRVRREWDTARQGDAPSTTPSPEAIRARQELADRVNAAIDALPERPREVFSLKRDASLSYQEIADLLAISPKTVEVHMSRALRLLREALGDLREQIRA